MIGISVYLSAIIVTSFLLGWLCNNERRRDIANKILLPLIDECRKNLRILDNKNGLLSQQVVVLSHQLKESDAKNLALQQTLLRCTARPRLPNGQFEGKKGTKK